MFHRLAEALLTSSTCCVVTLKLWASSVETRNFPAASSSYDVESISTRARWRDSKGDLDITDERSEPDAMNCCCSGTCNVNAKTPPSSKLLGVRRTERRMAEQVGSDGLLL